jgi:hypothetical protein
MVPSPDTTVEADRLQLEAYRHAGPAARLAAAFRLIELARKASQEGIRARHPEYGDEEIRMAYARLVLGDEGARAAWPGRDLVDP